MNIPNELIIEVIINIGISNPKEKEKFCRLNKRIRKICKDNNIYISTEILKKTKPNYKKKFDSVIKSIPIEYQKRLEREITDMFNMLL